MFIHFFLSFQIPGDIDREVRNHHHTVQKKGLTVQPIIVLVGPSLSQISTSYVQVNNVRYKLRTPLAAIDLCFKTFFAMDAAYPSECYAVWLFMQRYFYDIYLKEDLNNIRVTSVISSLKGMRTKL